MASGHAREDSRPRLSTMRSGSSIGESWNRPASPTFSTTTTGSRINLPASHALITRKDLRASIACLEELVGAAKAYRNALLAMSSATAAFANAMEACSRVKGCRSTNAGIAGASGLQYLISNHEQLLADTVYRQFEIPLLEALDHYKLITADRLAGYEQALTEQSGRIRRTEADNLKVGRRRKRDLQSFRQALGELQRQVDELDGIKASYHEEVLEGEDEIWDTVLSKVAFVIRSQLDFYEKIAGKTSDPILEPLVMSIPDPFNSYGPPKEDNQIFSVLSPLGLDASCQSPTPNLTRTGNSSASSSGPTPDKLSPMKSVPFFSSPVSPSSAQAASISVLATGQNASREDTGRARRELSVIDESGDTDSRNAEGLLPPESAVNGEDVDEDEERAEIDEEEEDDEDEAQGAAREEEAAQEATTAGVEDEHEGGREPDDDQAGGRGESITIFGAEEEAESDEPGSSGVKEAGSQEHLDESRQIRTLDGDEVDPRTSE